MNFDRTGLRLVKKGARVRHGKWLGTVTKVNRGQARVLWDGDRYALPYYCVYLEVI